MNIIILGCGKVGQRIAERLIREKGNNVTVIDRVYSVVQEFINHYDIMGVVGNGLDTETLLEAGIEKADLLIAVTDSDEQNLFACLLAKKLGGCKTIARVRTPEYNKALHLIKDELGIAMSINPERAAANEMARLLKFPSAIQIDTFARGRIEILKFRVPFGSPLDGLRVYDIPGKLGCDVLVCGVERESSVFIPNGEFTIHSDDLVSIVSSVDNATGFFKKIGIKTNSIKNCLIIGGSNTSFYLAKQLLQSGIAVKIIEQNQERCELLCQKLPRATIINGDGTQNRLLLEEGIENTASFVSLTNIDEENILLSLYAKTNTNGKIITKIDRIDYGKVIDGLDLGTTVCPKNITAEYIVRYVRALQNSYGCNIETMHFILNGKAEALEFKITDGSPVSGIPLEKLKLKDNILVACINRQGRVIIPRGHDTILPGDSVIIVTLRSGFKDIDDILK